VNILGSNLFFILVFLLLHAEPVIGQNDKDRYYHCLQTSVRGGFSSDSNLESFLLTYTKKSFKLSSVVPTFSLGITNNLNYDRNDKKGFSAEAGFRVNVQVVNYVNLHFSCSGGAATGRVSSYNHKYGPYLVKSASAQAGIGINLWRLESNIDLGLMLFEDEIFFGGTLSMAYVFSQTKYLRPHW
jgi:hypothetical protein